MKYLLIVAMLLSTPALAQQGPDVQTNVITSLQAQRNNALDQAAVLNAQLTVTKKKLDDADARIAAMQKQIDDADARIAAMQKQIDDAKKSPAPPEVPKEPK